MSNFRILTIACLSALALADGAMLASAAPLVIAADSDTLTLTGAKKLVANRLSELGKTDLRPGRAEFNNDGSVLVEVINIQGLTVRHARVDAKSRQVTDSRTGSPLV